MSFPIAEWLPTTWEFGMANNGISKSQMNYIDFFKIFFQGYMRYLSNICQYPFGQRETYRIKINAYFVSYDHE